MYIMYINTYILTLAHNMFTDKTEALVSGNKFLYACDKEVCHMSARPCFEK
jgi:hypothetical protein